MSDHTIIVIQVIKTFFVQIFHIFLPPLLNLSASIRFLLFLSLCAHLCMKYSLVTLIFLKRSLVFPILFFPSISLPCSLKKAFFSLFAVLWKSAFTCVYISLSPLPFPSLLFSTICKLPHTTILPCCISFSWGWFWTPPPV